MFLFAICADRPGFGSGLVFPWIPAAFPILQSPSALANFRFQKPLYICSLAVSLFCDRMPNPQAPIQRPVTVDPNTRS